MPEIPEHMKNFQPVMGYSALQMQKAPAQHTDPKMHKCVQASAMILCAHVYSSCEVHVYI